MKPENTVLEGVMRKELEELGERIAEQAAHIDAALHRLLTDVREFDAKGGWFQAGAISCANWLSWRVGWDLGTGREHVRVARRLGELPLVDDALRRGALSYSKVRAITRVATPAIEKTLVEWAAVTTAAQLERICRKFRMVQMLSERTDTEPPRRYVARRELDDGMVRIEVVVRPDEAAMVWSAMEAAGKDVSAEAQTAGFDRVEGLLALAQGRLRGDRPDRTPVEVVMTVERAALERSASDVASPGTVGAAAVAVFADGTCVSAETARRLTCDAAIVEMTEHDGIPIDVGRKTRTISTALHRALERRDVTCRFPGCCNRGYVEGHHVVHWANGGETNLANLLLICSHHHAFLHEHGFEVEMGADQVPRFFDPRGRPVLEAPPRRIDSGWGAATLAAANAAANANVDEEITADTNRCRWDGQPIDYGLCVNGLWQANGQR